MAPERSASVTDFPCLELMAPPGQLVHLGAGGRRQPAAAEDLGLLELAQALGEDVRAHVWQAGPQIGEALRAEQQLAHDEQRPALADDVERARHPAAVSERRRHYQAGQAVARHAVNRLRHLVEG